MSDGEDRGWGEESDDGEFNAMDIPEDDYALDSDFDVQSEPETAPVEVADEKKKVKKKGYVDPAIARKAAAKAASKAKKPEPKEPRPKPVKRKASLVETKQNKRSLRASTKQAREMSESLEESRTLDPTDGRRLGGRRRRELLQDLPLDRFIDLLAYNSVLQEKTLSRLMQDAERRRPRPQSKVPMVRVTHRVGGQSVSFPDAKDVYKPPQATSFLRPEQPIKLDPEQPNGSGVPTVATLLCQHGLPAMYIDPMSGEPYHNAECFKVLRERLYNERLQKLKDLIVEKDNGGMDASPKQEG